jgi:hypothetical protein
MSIDAMKQALDFLEWFSGDDHSIRPKHKAPEIAAALRQAIAEAEKQEPVAFRNTETGEFCTGGFLRKDWAKWQPLYTAPRKWVGLTDDEEDEIAEDWGRDRLPDIHSVTKAIEDKLKEKNT